MKKTYWMYIICVDGSIIKYDLKQITEVQIVSEIDKLGYIAGTVLKRISSPYHPNKSSENETD
jgi:hypothetical protein